MALETATYINGLVAANPLGSDPLADADGHLRLIKSTLKATFPNITGPVTATQGELNVPFPAGGTGFGIRTGPTSLTLRTLAAGSGISVANADGVSGNPTVTNTGVLSANSFTGAITVAGSAGVTVTNNAGTITLSPTSGYNGYGVRTVSTSAPSGGSDGDIWYQV